MRIYSLFLLLLLLTSCSVEETSNSHAVETSEHFTVYYKPYEFTQADVLMFIDKKEKLIAHITQTLDVDYSSNIPTWLYKQLHGVIAYYAYGTIHESKHYVIDDSGHEIGHAVSLEVMGRPQTQAMVEGIAEYVTFKPSGRTNIERYRAYLAIEYNHMKYTSRKLFAGGYDLPSFKYPEYLQSAAFIEFLISRYSLETFKEVWSISCDTKGDELISEIEKCYNIPFDSLEATFTELIK